MTFQQWWNSKPRTDSEENLYSVLEEVWDAATEAEFERVIYAITNTEKPEND